MNVRAVLFDLDGTLLDSLVDIANAANEVLAAAGFPPRSTDEYRRFIGEGVKVLFRRALPESHSNEQTAARCAAKFADIYSRHWSVNTRPYDGIAALVDELTERGLALAVLSNKPQPFTEICVEKLLSNWNFAAVVGAREDVPRKPDPTAALAIASQLQITPGEFLYVGDSGVDMQTAVGAGMRAVGVLWGFRQREELLAAGASALIERPLQLLELL